MLPTRQVVWVNTIGMRPPRLDWSTLKRGLGKLKQWGSVEANGQHLPSNLKVCNPKMWPWFSSLLDRRINGLLLKRQLGRIIENFGQSPLGITTIPIVADLMTKIPVAGWVYYCVDDFSSWPGLDGPTLAKMERVVIQRADVIVAASQHLQKRIASMGRSAHLLTHGVDLEFWQVQSTPRPDTSPLASSEPPYILFSGLLDRRMDVSFLRRLARDLHQGTIVLVGPENDPDHELHEVPRVKMIGPVAVASLPHLIQEASVLIMPYADLPVTQAMQPLKLKEYLATKKAVVVRDLPANREWQDCVDIAHSAEQFSELVRHRLAHGVLQSQLHGRRRLVQESWKSKATEFAELMHGTLARKLSETQ